MGGVSIHLCVPVPSLVLCSQEVFSKHPFMQSFLERSSLGGHMGSYGKEEMTLCLLFCKQAYSLHIHCQHLITTFHIYCSCLLCNAYCSIWLILGYSMHASQHFCCGEVMPQKQWGTGFLDYGATSMNHNKHIFP